MSQQVKVNRSIDFEGGANNARNIKGHMNPEKIYTEYNFNELALDTTNRYTAYLDTTSTVASGSGGALLTTAGTDTKTCSLTCGGIWWYPANSPTCEWKFRIDVATTVAINVGFNDAASEGSGALPFLISGTTVSDTATDGAMFCFDTNQTTKYWYVVNTNNGTQAGTILAATYAPAAATQATLRVSVDTAGNAYYYYNGIQVGYKALAVRTTVPLIPYIGIRNNAGVAHVLTARYCRVWGNTI